MLERVVEIVVVGRDCRASADAPQEPQLLEMADMREVPHEWGLERRDLPDELLVRERPQQGFRSCARVLESAGELRQ